MTNESTDNDAETTRRTINESADKIRAETDAPAYKDKEVMEQLYVEKGMTTIEISDLFGCSDSTIGRWLKNHGVEIRGRHGYEEGAWKDAELVNHLYHDKSMSGPEIADALGCSVGPIYARIDKTRSFGEANKIWQLKLPASFKTSENGYERASSKLDGEKDSVAVHRLVAVSEYGFDALDGMVVHHKNGIPWDNRPENLEVMPQSLHVREHFEEIPVSDKIAMLEMSVNSPATHEAIGTAKGVSRSTVNTIVARAKRGGLNV